MGGIGTLILIIAIIWIASKLFGGSKADILSYHEYAGRSFDVEGALTLLGTFNQDDRPEDGTV